MKSLFLLLLTTTPALAEEGGGGGALGAFVPLLVLVGIFYFFIIRPQNKKLKAHREMVVALRRGDEVITSGGIIGKIHRVIDDTEVIVDIAENTRVRVLKTTITSKKSTDTAPTNDNKSVS